MNSHRKDELYMIPMSNNWHLMDNTPQAIPWDYGQTAAIQLISPWLLLILVVNYSRKTRPTPQISSRRKVQSHHRLGGKTVYWHITSVGL